MTRALERLEAAVRDRSPRGDVAATLRSIGPESVTFSALGLRDWVREQMPGQDDAKGLIAEAYIRAALVASDRVRKASPNGNRPWPDPLVLAAGLEAAVAMDRTIVAIGFDRARAEAIRADDDAEWQREATSYWASRGGHPSLKHFPPGCLPPLLDADGRPYRP